MKNQLCKKGRYLQPKINAAKAALTSDEDSDASASDEKEEDDGHNSQKAQYTLKKKKDSPESTPQKDQSKTKLGKREPAPEEPDTTAPRRTAKVLDTPVDQLSMNEAFAQLWITIEPWFKSRRENSC